MIALLDNLPTWMTIRVAGFAAYILIAAGIALGISMGLPFVPKKSKAFLNKTHTTLTIAGTAIGMLHGMVTVIDTYVPYSWSELLIPFSAHYEPILSGLGTLSVYAGLIVILTTDLRNKLKRKLWLAFHMLSYPVFVMTTIHGIFMGTDSKAIGFVYVGAILLVLGLTAIRFAAKPRTAARNSTQPAPAQPEIVSPGHNRLLSERFRDARPYQGETGRR